MTGGRRSTSLSQQTDGGEPPSKLDALLQDNETLRAMLRRAWGTTTTRNEESIASSTHHLQATLDKKEEALKQERDKRAMAESLVAELRHDREMSLRAKDTEIRKLQDAVTHLKAENTVLHRRAQEDQQVVSILKKENQRLLEQALQKSPLHGKGNVSARSGSHAYSPDYATKVRSERIRADVPSIKNVGGVSPAAYTKTLVSSGVRSAEKPRTLLTGRAVSPATSVSGGRASVSHRSTSHVARNLTFEVGQRCTWHRMQGVVRYMGPVHGVGDEVVGVELLFRGSGDHDGTFNGVTYFRAPPRSAVFCQLSELQAPNDSRPSTPIAGRKTPRMVVSPPQAALHVTSNHWSLQRDDTNACLSEVEYEVYEPSTDISPNQPAFVLTDADVRRGLDLVLDAEAVDQLVKVTTTDVVPSHHNTTTDVVPSHHNTCDDTQARASTNTSDGATAVVDTSSIEVCIRKDDAVNELIGDSPAGPSTDASPQRDVPTTSSSDVLGDASN